MAKPDEGTAGPRPVNPEAKWIRLQEVGLSMFLVLPFAIGLAIILKSGVLLGMVVLALCSGGYCCISIGGEKRRELRKQGENK